MRRYLLALVPLALGTIGTTVALAAGDGRQLVSFLWIAWLWILIGLGTSMLILAALLVANGHRNAFKDGHARGTAEQRENQSRFLGRLDHELKNPLTAIRAGVSNLDLTDPAVATIDSQVVRLSRLTTDLRKLAEVRSVALEFDPVIVAELAQDVIAATTELPESATRSISMAFPRAPRPLPPVRGDYDLLFLALYNLVTNAMKYSRPGDSIELRGSEEDGWVTIEVADTGHGISPEDQERVWEELARGGSALEIAGSGLGLPFVKAIVERHGGTVSLRSRVQEGTLVRLRLPLGPA